jgi:cyclophilin family peptidyl-prolyl cis-trans isomerase
MKTITLFLCSAILCAGAITYAQDKQKKSKAAGKEKGKNPVAVIETRLGNIEIEFFPKDAPKTVHNFVKLASDKYFDGIIFHRVVKGFVIQGGDPTGTGTGGKSVYGPTFEDEIKAETQLYKDGYKRGMVAMANRGPNTNSSQFFIVLKDAGLPPSYTIFGKVIKGMEVVDKIGELAVDAASKPKEEVKMIKVTIK